MTTYEEALTEAVRLAESATELIRHHHTGERASAMAQASRTWAAIATLLARYGPLDRGDAEPATDADLSKACGCQGGTRWREHEQERGRGS